MQLIQLNLSSTIYFKKPKNLAVNKISGKLVDITLALVRCSNLIFRRCRFLGVFVVVLISRGHVSLIVRCDA